MLSPGEAVDGAPVENAEGSGLARLGKVIRVARILRTLRLLRLMKLRSRAQGLAWLPSWIKLVNESTSQPVINPI